MMQVAGIRKIQVPYTRKSWVPHPNTAQKRDSNVGHLKTSPPMNAHPISLSSSSPLEYLEYKMINCRPRRPRTPAENSKLQATSQVVLTGNDILLSQITLDIPPI